MTVEAPSWIPRFRLREILVAALLAVLAAGVGAGYVLRQTPVYQSAAQLLIDQPGPIFSASDVGLLDKLVALRLKYLGIIHTALIADPVAETLKLPKGFVLGSLAGAFERTSLLMSVVAHTSQPALTQKIAQAGAEELVKYVQNELDTYKVPPEKRFFFKIVTPAGPGRKISPTRNRALTVGAAGGLTALALALILQRLIAVSRRPAA